MSEVVEIGARGRKTRGGPAAGERHSPAAPTPEVECPLVFLGHCGGRHFFLSPEGERRELAVRDMSAAGLIDLCGGDTRWLCAIAPEWPRGANDRHGPAPDFYVRAAVAELVRRSVAAGLFDPEAPVRCAGVWRVERPEGRPGLIVHAGNALLAGGIWRPAGAVIDGAVYPARPPIARPADRPAGAADASRLLDAASLWRWQREGEAEIWCGWLGQAMLGGAPRWRAHLLVSGARGSGKTWLANLAAAALGAGAHPPRNNFTEAFLRQAFSGEARALILDESEPDACGRAQAVVEMLRRMSEGAGLKAGRGGADGRAVSFSVTGAAYLSSILHVPLSPQDRSRITELHLEPLDAGAEAVGQAEAAEAAIADMGMLSPALRARAVAGWARFLDAFTIYRAAAMAAGRDAREADQLATLLAGRDLLLADAVPDSDFAAEEVARFAWVAESAREAAAEDGEGWECLKHLYSAPVDLWAGGERLSVARLLDAALWDAHADDRRRAIQALGLKVAQADGEKVLLVANGTHQGLARLFRGTRWEGGVWTQALRYLPGARPWGTSTRFDGVVYRATALSGDALPKIDNQSSKEMVSAAGDF